ncbi:PASTA domain-containing protein [Acaricomes phytoseiuli]|uniref:Stk1 family PASTA domain-containing Ser/Thr kinase n=1 Tax=Acaricomes phytoseiuli TaxID=291968 RepID=UPI00036A668D|nr:Stk1 family PASTA domain-containing Ser/Thr kinase [Acaricomes phytoseiuli]MCW1249536.1 PASTA domain-containing protein [Acaricomes phytoseiuli]
MHSKVQEPLDGLLIDQRYRVLGKVARGGMATVYRALDLRLDREVAIKILHPHLSSDNTFLDRLGREAKAAARLSHPRVVGVLDQGEEERDGQRLAYLVMEYLPGHTLRDVLREQGPLTPRLALAYLEAVVEGLAAAHSSGLVHRDIKPENVLIADDGRIKLGDFGLARAVTTSTNTGTLIGTVAYLSPELVMGRLSDARSDIYAVGIMLYEMLTGRQPFQGEVPIQVAYQHVNATVPAPSEEIPELSEDLDDLVRWCTEQDPEDRPNDGTALLGELRHIRSTLSDEELDTGGSEQESTNSQDGQGPGQETEFLGTRGDTAVTTALTAAEHPTEAIDAQGFSAVADGQQLPQTIALQRYPGYPAAGVAGEGATEYAEAAEETTMSPRQAKAARKQAAKQAARNAATPATALRRGNPRRRGLLILVLVLLLALLGAGAGWFFGSGPGALATVPDLRNSTATEASSTLEQLGFRTTTRQVNDETILADRVIGTEPPANSEQRKFMGVVLTVSKGPMLYAVPQAVGQDLQAAQAALENGDLALGQVTEQYDENIPVGQVISQNPSAGEQRRAGSKVDLVASQGPRPIPVPGVVGKTQDAAITALQAVDLTPVVAPEQVNDAKVPAGSVVSQNPADAQVRKGTEVTLVISKGPRMVQVPSFIGKQAQQAAEELKRLNLEVKIDEVLGGFFGTVRAQDPVNTSVPEGSVITLTVV